ncbi:MAG: molybdopterin-dependent oxidoreductase [Microlunatus sp.]|nr:molybdopterin-dependent oxidoreductase [Microlunatus sp.]
MEQPSRIARALAGVLSALAALGVGHGVAALIGRPATSPLVAVGSVAVDAAPTPMKELAVRTLGTADKPVLIGAIAVVLVAVAAGIGLIAWRRPRLGLAAIGALGLVGGATALARSGLADAGALSVVPSLVAAGIGVAALAVVRHSTATRPRTPTPAMAPKKRRRDPTPMVVGVLAALGAGVGEVVDRTRRAARDLIRLPRPHSVAAAIPDGVQVPGVQPFTTANGDFYRVDISLVTPRVDLADWTLRIDGAVERSLELTYDDLLAMPLIERDITLACVSNEVGGPYVSSARWLGVPFSELIARAGVKTGVEQVFSYSSDSGYTCSTPYAAVNDGRDAMIAIGMNGQILPDAHGFPARMVVPGLFGFVSATKWLERIEFTSYAERTAYWTERDWATEAPVLTQSKIEVPKSLATLDPSKPVIAGTAWAQHRGIEKVEVRIDDGEWQEATLADSAGIDTWRQWYLAYDGPTGRHTAQVRATDGTGQLQSQDRTKVFPDGARGWHQIQFSVA